MDDRQPDEKNREFENPEQRRKIRRRAALAVLGLGAATVYAAPRIEQLELSASAKPSKCGKPPRPPCPT
ncbi:MAG: hypothetical protein FJX52_12130 [Alphaproteobacteria bacterium]|nr:hypothetical protein [Alphaproteobacteria bacterium]